MRSLNDKQTKMLLQKSTNLREAAKEQTEFLCQIKEEVKRVKLEVRKTPMLDGCIAIMVTSRSG